MFNPERRELQFKSLEGKEEKEPKKEKREELRLEEEKPKEEKEEEKKPKREEEKAEEEIEKRSFRKVIEDFFERRFGVPIGLRDILDRYLDKAELEKKEKRELRKNLFENLSEEISKFKERGEYDSEKILKKIEETVGKADYLDKETKEKVLEVFIKEEKVEGESKKRLKEDWEGELKDYLERIIKKEKIDTNIKDRLEKGLRKEAKDWLYAYLALLNPESILKTLSLKDQKKLKESLERLITREKTSEFVKEIYEYSKEIARGGRVSLVFSKELFKTLPKEIQKNPEKFGIDKKEYKISFGPQELKEILKREKLALKEMEDLEKEIGELIPKAKKLIKESKIIFKENPGIPALMTGALDSVIEGFKIDKVEGTTKEKLEEAKKTLEKDIIGYLEEVIGIVGKKPPESQWKEKISKGLKKIKWGEILKGLGYGYLFGFLFLFSAIIYFTAAAIDYIDKELKKK